MKQRLNAQICKCNYCNSTVIVIDEYGECRNRCRANFTVHQTCNIVLTQQVQDNLFVKSDRYQKIADHKDAKYDLDQCVNQVKRLGVHTEEEHANGFMNGLLYAQYVMNNRKGSLNYVDPPSYIEELFNQLSEQEIQTKDFINAK